MPRRLLAAAAVGALLLGLAGCGDGDEGAVTTPPPSVSVGVPSDGGVGADPSDGGGSETDAPTAAAPDIPPPDPADYAGMDERTENGAVQAFRHYVATAMWAHQTGDDSKLSNLQADTCEGCSDFNTELPLIKEHGKYWSEFKVVDVKITPHESENFDYEIGYSFTLPEHTRPDFATDERVEYDPVEYTAIGGMSWSVDRWRVGGLKAEWGPDVHS